MIATGENHLTLPHSYSCTMQLRLLRSMLVLEEGDTLWICRAAPRDWLRDGKEIAATDAPTSFGRVSYRISAVEDGAVRLRIDPAFHSAPAKIRVRLREPAGRRIASVSPQLPSVRFHEDLVEIQDTDRRIDLRVRFAD